MGRASSSMAFLFTTRRAVTRATEGLIRWGPPAGDTIAVVALLKPGRWPASPCTPCTPTCPVPVPEPVLPCSEIGVQPWEEVPTGPWRLLLSQDPPQQLFPLAQLFPAPSSGEAAATPALLLTPSPLLLPHPQPLPILPLLLLLPKPWLVPQPAAWEGEQPSEVALMDGTRAEVSGGREDDSARNSGAIEEALSGLASGPVAVAGEAAEVSGLCVRAAGSDWTERRPSIWAESWFVRTDRAL